MTTATQRFEAVSWAELMEALAQIATEEPMREAGMRCAEVTDLVQGQVLLEHPALALQMPRMLELRFACRNIVAYLRTGIPVGSEQSTPSAGPFLLGLRVFNLERRDYSYIKYPRVMRIPTWRQNLKRRIREMLEEASSDRLSARSAEFSLTDLVTLEQDDLEAGLSFPAQTAEPVREALTPAGDHRLDVVPAEDGTLESAGVSLPVWVSATLSLLLILGLLLTHR